MNTPTIILVRPQLVENIGTTARAMMNCALGNLRLVEPRDPWPLSETMKERMVSASAGADAVFTNTKLYDTTQQAVADLNSVYALTARPRDMIKEVLSPRAAMQEIHTRIQNGEKVGLMFGPERTGLINEDLVCAEKIISIPANPDFSSFNLAQSVLIMAYEWITHAQYKDTSFLRKQESSGTERAARCNAPLDPSFRWDDGSGLGGDYQNQGYNERKIHYGKTRPATKDEVFHLFDHLERELELGGFFTSLEMKPTMTQNLRNAILRAELTEQEVRTWHGMITALAEGPKKPRK